MTNHRTFALRISIALVLVLGLLSSTNATPIPQDGGADGQNPTGASDTATDEQKYTCLYNSLNGQGTPTELDSYAKELESYAAELSSSAAEFKTYAADLKSYAADCKPLEAPTAVTTNDYEAKIVAFIECYNQAGEDWTDKKVAEMTQDTTQAKTPEELRNEFQNSKEYVGAFLYALNAAGAHCYGAAAESDAANTAGAPAAP